MLQIQNVHTQKQMVPGRAEDFLSGRNRFHLLPLPFSFRYVLLPFGLTLVLQGESISAKQKLSSLALAILFHYGKNT